MKMQRRLLLACLPAALMLTGLTGCSRAQQNYQIAEAIGTLGKYEGNEPVETPKMKAAREMEESEAALETEKQEALAEAAQLAKQYRYEEAIQYLENSELLQEDDRATAAAEEYRTALNRCYTYEGDIPHFSFSNLVIDPARAFDGDEYEQNYRSNMITLTEFQNILQVLYENGYVLTDLHLLAEETQNGTGGVAMASSELRMPQGKKPMILSVDNLSYSSVRNGDGVARKLVLTEDGEVAALYTDDEGHDLKGDYDVVPVLEAFLDEHPDFSYQGARGIISVAGKNGVFGYEIEDTEANAENRETVKAIADALRKDGWTFACAGYDYAKMGDMSYDSLSQDIQAWLDNVEPLVGKSDTLIYPYGSEVDYSTEKAVYLIGRGFHYLLGLWPGGDHLEVNEQYLRQTRRMVTGYVFQELPNAFDTYFMTSAILDPERNQ